MSFRLIVLVLCSLDMLVGVLSQSFDNDSMREFCFRHYECNLDPCSAFENVSVNTSGNCAELLCSGVNSSGLYEIELQTFSTEETVQVKCDMKTDGGGWMVFQTRGEFESTHENFIRDWEEYIKGFGDLSKEFWLGLESLHMMSMMDDFVLRIDIGDYEGTTAYAVYEHFKLFGAEQNYTLKLGKYSGTAGDGLSYASGAPFATHDRNDQHACSKKYKAGWWFRKCHESYLNGRYLGGQNDLHSQGVVWKPWRGNQYSLKWTEMKLRPSRYHRLASGRAKTPLFA